MLCPSFLDMFMFMFLIAGEHLDSNETLKYRSFPLLLVGKITQLFCFNGIIMSTRVAQNALYILHDSFYVVIQLSTSHVN